MLSIPLLPTAEQLGEKKIGGDFYGNGCLWVGGWQAVLGLKDGKQSRFDIKLVCKRYC